MLTRRDLLKSILALPILPQLGSSEATQLAPGWFQIRAGDKTHQVPFRLHNQPGRLKAEVELDQGKLIIDWFPDEPGALTFFLIAPGLREDEAVAVHWYRAHCGKNGEWVAPWPGHPHNGILCGFNTPWENFGSYA